MYYFLTEAVKRRFLLELRQFWATHPKYTDLPDNIQGKYSFKEAPNHAIILKSVSASPVQLSADNFMGTISSHVQLARVGDHPGLSVEHVRENVLAIQANAGRFPSPPGIYYLTVEAMDEDQTVAGQINGYRLYVDPLLEAHEERPEIVGGINCTLRRPFMAETTRVYELPGNIPYIRGAHYTEDADAGTLRLTEPLNDGRYIVVSYRYAGTSTGPFFIRDNYGTREAIPGAVVVFGRRISVGDRVAVIVHPERQDAALLYGGKWDMSLDFDITARDVYAQQEITDMTVMYLFGILRNRLSSEGIEITAVSMGGESEESYDDNGDDYFYTASFSVQVLTDWGIEVPAGPPIRRFTTLSNEDEVRAASMSDDQLIESDITSSVRMEDAASSFSDPFFMTGRISTFERIR